MCKIEQPHTNKYILYRIKVRLEDYTNDDDPNIRVTNSFMVKGYDEKIKLIERIRQFVDIYKLENWNRSDTSILIELYMHNIVYYLLRPFKFIPRIKKLVNRAQSTDLTNSDENLYLYESLYDAIKKIKYIINSK